MRRKYRSSAQLVVHTGDHVPQGIWQGRYNFDGECASAGIRKVRRGKVRPDEQGGLLSQRKKFELSVRALRDRPVVEAMG
jgi:hypothetical protein